MQRESQKDRTILCKFDPTEPGDYRVEVRWAGEGMYKIYNFLKYSNNSNILIFHFFEILDVPGSPFSVMIFDTQEELHHFLNYQVKV